MLTTSQGTSIFSKTEIEIIKWIRKGKTSAEIAALRNCSTRTIEKHRSNIIRKLDIKSAPNALLVWALNNPHLN